MVLVNHEREIVQFLASLEPLLSDHRKAMQKDASQFSQFLIPALDCAIMEEWDYAYILWHRTEAALNAIKPLLASAGLWHLSD